MSYFDLPRIHFSGKFTCDVSTVNNDPDHYDPSVTNPSPWWNPEGTHAVRWTECVVSSAVDAAGRLVQDAAADPVAGAAVRTSSAVLVDLDTDEQGVSMFFGLNLTLTLPDGTQIGGPMDRAGLNSLWQNVMPTVSWRRGGGSVNMSASFQSVVRVPPAQWPATPASPLLQHLKAACETDSNGNIVVAVKFVLDAYQTDTTHPSFKIGRIVGTFGPGKSAEPRHCPGQRWLKPRALATDATGAITAPWYQLAFNGAPFKVDSSRKKLILDLANSIPLVSLAGPSADLGQLQAMIIPPSGEPVRIGEVDYSQLRRGLTAGITEVDLTDEQAALLHSHPLKLTAGAIADSGAADLGSPDVLCEDPSGLDFAVDAMIVDPDPNVASFYPAGEGRAFRMASDTDNSIGAALGTLKTAAARVYVTQWGNPASGSQLAGMVSAARDGVPTTPLGVTVTPSDATGFASVNLQAVSDPGDRTPQLDGQVFYVTLQRSPGPASPTLAGLKHGENVVLPSQAAASYVDPVQERRISIHIYSAYSVQLEPTWERDIQPLFVPYMKLYPAMRERIDLTDRDTFLFYAGVTGPAALIPQRMQAPFDDPSYMPITRDLSPNKTQTIFYFIGNSRKRAAEPSG